MNDDRRRCIRFPVQDGWQAATLDVGGNRMAFTLFDHSACGFAGECRQNRPVLTPGQDGRLQYVHSIRPVRVVYVCPPRVGLRLLSGLGGPPYAISYLDGAKRELRPVLEAARRLGRADEVLQDARAVDDRLHLDPERFGEPLRQLPDAQLELRHAIVGSLEVRYGVHNDDPVVFVCGFRGLFDLDP